MHDSLEEYKQYELTWPGKKIAIQAADIPTKKRLVSIKKDSVDWDRTCNLYIEGDNLDALKLLQQDYNNRVGLVYIDPPYNTGKEFIYNDERLHSDWLNMMYPRLKLTHGLLADDGVIFISIDDHEIANLRLICDEIFGNRNFVAQIIWERAYAPVSLKKHFSANHEYILVYAKQIENVVCNGLKRSAEANQRYKNPDNDPRGPWQSDNLTVGPAILEKCYPIITPGGQQVFPPNGRCWLYTKERFAEMVEDNRIWFGKYGNNVPREKRFLSEVKQRVTPKTIWTYREVGHSQGAKQELKKLFDGAACFDYPKPLGLILRILELYSQSDSIVLDYFSGSATTAHAVMAQNAKDYGKRQYIMVQIPELTPKDSSAYRAGFANICQIGKARIKRAAQLIQVESGADIDYGVKVFKIGGLLDGYKK